MQDKVLGARRLVDHCFLVGEIIDYPTLPEITDFDKLLKIVAWLISGEDIPLKLVLKRDFGETTGEELKEFKDCY